MEQPNILKDQECPICHKKALTMMESVKEIPFFGEVFIFSMSCENCKYHKADVEAVDKKDPYKYTFEINSEEDLKVRVVKASEATIKIPHIITIESTPSSNGYVTNIEGILNRVKKIIESARDNEEDPAIKKKAKNQLKKLQKVLWGNESLKIIIEDPSGNSAIISEKAQKQKLRK